MQGSSTVGRVSGLEGRPIGGGRRGLRPREQENRDGLLPRCRRKDCTMSKDMTLGDAVKLVKSAGDEKKPELTQRQKLTKLAAAYAIARFSGKDALVKKAAAALHAGLKGVDLVKSAAAAKKDGEYRNKIAAMLVLTSPKHAKKAAAL